ncbi:cytochrome c family protein [Sphingorhabdus sp.]|uniref:c-type cytochrome n=1 Tax=Sphingorhabdus sp. TaxID=1902408 RepID=UPI0035B33031|nr:cytochrome c family protein [Sphingomonadaceae bacterium]
MADRNNTIAGWALAAGIVALGSSIVFGKLFHGEVPGEGKQGYVIQGVESGEGGGAAEVPLATLLAAADPAKGEAVFAKCKACHTINSGGANGVGPNLWGAMGKPHGHVPGFAYSDALKAVPGNWDWEGMNKWLANPKKYAPGTKMSFAGLGKAEDRAALLLYINAQGSNLPLPAAPAADAAPADGAAPAEGGDAAAAAPADAAAKEAAAAPAK